MLGQGGRAEQQNELIKTGQPLSTWSLGHKSAALLRSNYQIPSILWAFPHPLGM